MQPGVYDSEYFANLTKIGAVSRLDMRTYFASWLRRFVRRRRCETVVDVGCGDGYYLKQLPSTVRAIGIDPSTSAFQRNPVAADDRKSVQFVCADGLSLPLSSRIADLVLLLDVIEHVRADSELLLEAKRILKPDGLLLMSTPNTCSFVHRNKRRGWFAYRDESHCNLNSPAYWGALLEQVGLRCIRRGSDSCWDLPYACPIPPRAQWLVAVPFSIFTRLVVGFWPWTQGENYYALAQLGQEELPGARACRKPQ